MFLQFIFGKTFEALWTFFLLYFHFQLDFFYFGYFWLDLVWVAVEVLWDLVIKRLKLSSSISFLLTTLTRRWLILFFLLFVINTAADEKPNHSVPKTKFILFIFRLLFLNSALWGAPVEGKGVFLEFLVCFRLYHWLAVMLIVKPTFHAEVHGTFGALKVVNVRYLGLTSLVLTVSTPSSIFAACNFVFYFILDSLALSGLHVLIPYMSRGHSKRRFSF